MLSNTKKPDKSYEFFDVTADIGFLSYGNTLKEAFENAGLAMFNIISNTDNVDPVEDMDIEVESEDLVSLLYDYLEELLFLHEVNFILFSKFNVDIEKIDGDNGNQYRLKANIKGESINWDVKHERGSEVKAITFHMMEVKKIDDYYRLRVILDL